MCEMDTVSVAIVASMIFISGISLGIWLGESKGREKGIREGRALARKEQSDAKWEELNATWEELKPWIEAQLGKKASHL